MTEGRIPGLFGAVSAIAFTAGVLLVSRIPVGGGASTDEEIRDFYQSSDDRVMVILGLYLAVAGLVCFVPFLVALSRRSQIAEGEAGLVSRAAVVFGMAFVVLAMAGAAALGAIAGAISLGGEPDDLPDTGVARFMGQLGYALLLVAAAISAGAFMAAVSWVIVRTGWLPAWTGWLGFVAAVLMLVSVIFLPLAALPVWILVVSIVLLARASQPVEADSP